MSEQGAVSGFWRDCGCMRCQDDRRRARPDVPSILPGPGEPGWRYACEMCGDKRCPHHSNHRFSCSKGVPPVSKVFDCSYVAPDFPATKAEVLARLDEAHVALMGAADAMARRYGMSAQVHQICGAAVMISQDWMPTIRQEPDKEPTDG